MLQHEFTFVWRIGNFSYYWQKETRVEIASPVFDVNLIRASKWRLVLSDRYRFGDEYIPRNKKCVRLYLHRVDLNLADMIYRNIQISFVKDDKSLVHWSTKQITHGVAYYYFRNQSCGDFPFLKLKENFPRDILIVRCKIGERTYSLNTVVRQCFANTHLAGKHISFVAVVEKFSDLIPEFIRTVQIKSASVEQPISTINVCLSDKGKLNISIPVKADYICFLFCEVLVLDYSGNWQNCGQDSEWRKFGEVCEFPLTLDFKTLRMQNYLHNGGVTFKCELTYTTEEEPQRIETMEYGYDSSETFQQLSPCVKDLPAPEKMGDLKFPSTLTDDLVSLFIEGTLCDTKLCTETETFPAHKAILSARSPVFKKMFTTDMRENTGDCVDIPDLNVDTIRKLLMFMYTDTVDVIDWPTAKELYFAGDKYDIVSLKLKCSTFLKLNIQPSNCCELLLLSDMHQDADLKGFVQDYIVTRDQIVFGSEEWRIFMGNHVQLAADTMFLKYARK